MPQFDLRGIKVAKYVNTSGTISYTGKTSIGDAMGVNLEFRFAEGRLYAESSLAEYIRKVVGGTISIAEKYIPKPAQTMMYGAKTKTRSISYTPEGSETQTTSSVESLVYGAKSKSSYVGVAFYAPDMIDGVEKYTCVLLKKSMFGLPGMNIQTAGENIVFSTPTTTGEFMPDDSGNKDATEVAVCDDINEAIAWVDAALT